MEHHLPKENIDVPVTEQHAACEVLGPGSVAISLQVNGELHALSVETRTTLAEVLRGPLGLTGTKIACNHGTCAACSVWLDDLVVAACSILAVEVGDRKITTIEGLGTAEQLHPVQTAFIEHDAVQCGFCTPGMVMSCAALLARQPHPSREDIELALSGHVCRCGTYPHILNAMLALSAVEQTSDE